MSLPKLTLTEIFLRAEVGDVIYTEKKDTAVASYASRAGVKVTTERLLVIHATKRELFELTRATVLDKKEVADGTKAKAIRRTRA